jgi:hypothetical protein
MASIIYHSLSRQESFSEILPKQFIAEKPYVCLFEAFALKNPDFCFSYRSPYSKLDFLLPMEIFASTYMRTR